MWPRHGAHCGRKRLLQVRTRLFHTACCAYAKKSPNPYHDTLRLPQTPFSLRAFAKDREPLFRPATTSNLYRWQRENLGRPGERDFVLHDGPPYANGHLHMGHALNKIVKDMILRYQVLRGRRVHYMPGWDCHGLPIELKALGELGPGQSPSDVRSAARRVALREMEQQRHEFQQLGIMADWQNTYQTLDFSYELEQLRLFAQCVERGLIYEQFRPVYWSPSTHTALAEAEIEYDDKHVSRSTYVRFPLRRSKILTGLNEPVYLAVWTTTPWSLLGNMALAVRADAAYVLVRRMETHELYIVAEDLAESLASVPAGRPGESGTLGPFEKVATVAGADLVGSTYECPWMLPTEERFLMNAPFVTTDAGTGIVHMAPAHGQEDYEVWRDAGFLKKYGLKSPVDALGRLVTDASWGLNDVIRADVARLHGLEALGDGTERLLQLLDAHSVLLSERPYVHSYPIDWRTKKPILTRATAQWFADLRQSQGDALKALESVSFTPSTGRQRLRSLISHRSEWCISRQRTWGVPIPVVYDAATHEPIINVENVEHILRVLSEHGTTNVWWTLNPRTFVAPAFRDPSKSYYIKGDTLDVWFDSGSSWAVLQRALNEPVCTPHACADVYVEGSDQHRGWFQSSLLTRVSVCGSGATAPFANLLTHGFVVDEAGRKMSKSLGNVIAPSAFLHGDPEAPKDFPPLGADVLRWWAAKTDYTKDSPISVLIMKHVSDEVRKLRNTARFMLANLSGHARSAMAPLNRAGASLLHRYVMHELYCLETSCRDAYTRFDFAFVARSLIEFATKTLSTLYYDSVKDTLYAGSSEDQLPILAAMNEILHTITCVLAPILPHLAEDLHWYRHGATCDPTPEEVHSMPSFFQQGWHTVSDVWYDPSLEHHMQELLRIRSETFALATRCKDEDRLIKGPAETDVALYVPQAQALCDLLHAHHGELPDLFHVAHLHLYTDMGAWRAAAPKDGWYREVEMHHLPVHIRLQASSHEKCPRCWKYHSESSDTLCKRCATVVH